MALPGVKPCLVAFWDDFSSPAMVVGPLDLAPLRRAGSDLSCEGISEFSLLRVYTAWVRVNVSHNDVSLCFVGVNYFPTVVTARLDADESGGFMAERFDFSYLVGSAEAGKVESGATTDIRKFARDLLGFEADDK